jgi:PIN domain nuclease of toxin-antitoxin system
MRYLIDTHTLLWFLADAPELSAEARTIILEETNQILVSMASFWEISIKNALGKLELKVEYAQLLEEIEKNGFDLLSIHFNHTVAINTLPFYHRDPFDRMIIAQAITENMNIVSVDNTFDNYLINNAIKRIW